MSHFDYLQIITLAIFPDIFIGRSVWLSRKGTQLFMLGNGKKGSTALLEKSFFLFFPIPARHEVLNDTSAKAHTAGPGGLINIRMEKPIAVHQKGPIKSRFMEKNMRKVIIECRRNCAQLN